MLACLGFCRYWALLDGNSTLGATAGAAGGVGAGLGLGVVLGADGVTGADTTTGELELGARTGAGSAWIGAWGETMGGWSAGVSLRIGEGEGCAV